MPSLRQSSDTEPGLTRRRAGKGWSYVDPAGRPVPRNARERIERLAIPPAWRDVWICRSGRGHLQATGIDAAGRKQYLYHPLWREERDRLKYERLLRFADGLPALRRTVRRDMGRRRLDRAKALATAVHLLDRTHIRVGSEEYADANKTYGLATLRSKHLTIDGDTLVLDFTGKSGVSHRSELRDARLATVLAEMDAMPGYEVLKYVDDDGRVVDVRSADINAYIKEHMGEDFSAKDFRTWTATVAAAVALDALEPLESETARKRAVAGVCKTVAGLLGNTPAVCRKSYIDPRVIERYTDGVTISALQEEVRDAVQHAHSTSELAVLALLRRELELQEDAA